MIAQLAYCLRPAAGCWRATLVDWAGGCGTTLANRDLIVICVGIDANLPEGEGSALAA